MKKILPLILITLLTLNTAKAQQWTTYTNTNHLNAIAIDAQGNKWIGTTGGVLKFDDTSWTIYTKADGLADNGVQAIAIDALNNKWFGTYRGISRFTGGGSGIKEQNKDAANVSIFPNPATNHIEIETPQHTDIEIINTQGQLIKTIPTVDNKTKNSNA